MSGYNNYGNYGNYANYGQNMVGSAPMQPRPMNNGNAFNGNFTNAGFQQNPMPVQDNRYIFTDYVSGRAGADAYQIPNGVDRVLLFDNDTNRMFVKGYDNTGRPRVLEDNDFQPHVEPEPQTVQPNIDLSSYATKEDIRQMIESSFSNFKMPNMSGYVTQTDFDKALSELFVDNRGRIVRNNEPNA